MTAFAGCYLDSDRYIKAGEESVTFPAQKMTEAFDGEGNMLLRQVPEKDSPYPLKEVWNLTTNTTAQWSLGYMEVAKLKEMRDNKGR